MHGNDGAASKYRTCLVRTRLVRCTHGGPHWYQSFNLAATTIFILLSTALYATVLFEGGTM